MNVYKKYCSCVYVAECDTPHAKGEIIAVTTQYGKENQCEVHNLVLERNGKYYYSITRADGYNTQERARQKSEKYSSAASGAISAANSRCDAAVNAVKDIPFGQPILVDHSSAKKHRAALDDMDRNMKKSIELRESAEEYAAKAAFWKRMENKIDLSMPESIDYYEYQMQEATRVHAGLKDGSIPREYGMQLQYAKKAVNDAQKNYDLAVKLWK